MKILLSLFLLIPSLLTAQMNNDYQKKIFISKGDTLNYNIRFPSNYNPNLKYPVITFLHGSGERGNDNETPLKHGSSFLSNNQKYNSIVIFPQCPTNQYWRKIYKNNEASEQHIFDLTFNSSPEKPTLLVKELLDSLQKINVADPTRMYIGGLSLGGFGTFDMIERYPDYFAAAFPICGGGDVTKASTFAKKVPIWIFHGEKDEAVAVELSRQYYKKLKELNANVKYTEYPNVGHNSWDNVFQNTELMPWILAQKKK